MALPKTYRAVARLGWTSTTGDPEGELSQTGRIPDDPRIPTGDLMQRPHAYSAVKVGGQARLRARPRGRVARAGRAARDRLPGRTALARRRARGVRDRVLVRHVRAPARRGPRRRLLRAARAHRDRRRSGSRTPTPSGSSRWRDALAFLPERPLDEAEADAVAHGRRVAGPDRRPDAADRRRRADRDRPPARRRDPARRGVRRREGHVAARRRAAPAQGRGRHVRRRPPRPPRGHQAATTPSSRSTRTRSASSRPQALPKLLDSPAIKRDLIAGLGVDELVTIPFDREFASKSADEFVEEVLIEKLGATRRVGGGELPLRQGGEGRPRPAARRAASSRRASCRWSRSRTRPCPRRTSAAWSRPATSSAPRASSARPSCSRARS